jgi:3-oxoacid CoA-transferase
MRIVTHIDPIKAASLVKDGDTILVGGFGMTGCPVHLLHALADKGTKNLTYVGNNVGEPGLGGGRLLRNGQITKLIGSYFTSNPEAVEGINAGAIEFALIPQGSLAEAIRAGGAGIGGFYTPSSAGTSLAGEERAIDGKAYVFQPAIRGDVTFVRAWKADTAGNLVYRRTEENFNKAMATAADIVIAEVEEIVEVGELEPGHIHTPGIFVDYLVEAKLTADMLGSSASTQALAKNDFRWQIAKRARKELKAGDFVNLGVGIPTLIADLVRPEDDIVFHTENGMLGIGPAPTEGSALEFPVDAGKRPVSEVPGTSYFDSADAFAMIRGGHVDVAVMGALQVDERGRFANWSVPGKSVLGVGGAMDLAVGAKRLIVTMTHTDARGKPKLVKECGLPLTAARPIDMLITDQAVFTFAQGRATLVELMPGVDLDQVRAHTEADFLVQL